MTLEEKKRVEETYKQEKNRLLRFIRNRIPDETSAEDLLQDVFLRLILNATGIRTIENITAWIYSVARNRIIDFFRKNKTESLEDLYGMNGDPEQARSLEDLLPELEDSAEDQMFADLIWDEIQEALEEMPREQRDVFVFHELENLSMKKIIEITGVNQNTLLARKRYAILFLRKRLQKLYNQINE